MAAVCLGMLFVGATQAMAESPQMAAEAPTAQAMQEPIDSGNNAWMLTSSALVLLMTAPGLALFYCGLVRKKNVLGVMMQCVFLMGLMGVIWAVWGYSLSFGGDGPLLGNGDYLLLGDVQAQWTDSGPVFPVEGNIPRLTHMLFQGMFFIITPALMIGAFAERMKFSTMVVFMVLWATLVYCPLCHWVWHESGILCYGGPNAGICAGGGAGFCRGNGRAYQFGHLGAGLLATDRPTPRIR